MAELFQGGFYDFTSDLSSKDTAYTNLALAPHTDNTYFTDPTGLQMLHLLSHEEGEGGLSTLVDGFQVADVMATSHKVSYDALRSTTTQSHASGNDEVGSITPTNGNRTVIHRSREQILCDGRFANMKIRWNNSDRGVFRVDHDGKRIDAWYKAAKIFDSLINSKEYLWEFQLQPGRPLSRSVPESKGLNY